MIIIELIKSFNERTHKIKRLKSNWEDLAE